jgi:hypothetical protein
MSAVTPPFDPRSFLPQVRRYTLAGNRFGFHRTRSAAFGGYVMQSERWHRSPPVDLINLRLIVPWWSVDAAAGEQAIGNPNPGQITAAIAMPATAYPGSNQAFRWAGSTTLSPVDRTNAISDPLGMLLPKNTPYRLRSWVNPGAAGFVPYGRPGMTFSNGNFGGFGAGAEDASSFAASVADATQSGSIGDPITADSLFEGILVGQSLTALDCWSIDGDSLAYGALEVGVGGSATAANAGDAYGNAGVVERLMGLLGAAYLNGGQSGASAAVWATPGYASLRDDIAAMTCNKKLIWLGINDETDTAANILANIQRRVSMARTYCDRVVVFNLPPRTNTTDAGATLANQTVDAARTSTLLAVNAALAAGAVSGIDALVDIHSLVCDPTQTDKWQAGWSPDGVHYAASVAATLAAAIKSRWF